jgi:hypothetical protein
MKTIAITLLVFSGLSSAQAVQAPEPSPRDLHAASCVAALDANTQELAEQIKAGKEASRSLLLDRLVSGAAFVGDAYLHGDSDEHQARELAEQAREAQKRLPAKELAARQAACADEGMKLYESGNGLQRAIVKRVAQKRMDKLLGA